MSQINIPESDHIIVSYGYKTEYQLAEWYASLDCYIFPSSGEGWSFTPRESLSFQIPTIISNCIVHQELVPFCKVIDLPVTIDDIKKAIIAVYENLEEYKLMAINGQEYIKINNNSDNTIHSINSLLLDYSKKYK